MNAHVIPLFICNYVQLIKRSVSLRSAKRNCVLLHANKLLIEVLKNNEKRQSAAF